MKPFILILITFECIKCKYEYISKHKCVTHFMTFILLHFHIWWSFLPYMKTHHTWNPGPWTFRATVKMTIPARWWQAFRIYGQVEVELLGKKLRGLTPFVAIVPRGSLNLTILFFLGVGGGTSILAYTCACICIYILYILYTFMLKYIHVSFKHPKCQWICHFHWNHEFVPCCLHPFWTQLLICACVKNRLLWKAISCQLSLDWVAWRCICRNMFFRCWTLTSKNQEVWKLVMCS